VAPVVGHSRKYARQIRLFPGLRVDGGVTKVTLVQWAGKFITLAMLFSAGMGFAGIYPWVEITESQWVEIETGDTVKAQSDGDLFFLGKGDRMRVELIRGALEVKTPFGKAGTRHPR